MLIPPRLQSELLIKHLQRAGADFVIAEAGALELASIVESCPKLTHIIWVAKSGSRHMDWAEVPEGIGGKIEVATWQDLVEEGKSPDTAELPVSEKGSPTSPLVMFWPSSKTDVGEMVELSSQVSSTYK